MDINQYRQQVDEQVRRASEQAPVRLTEQLALHDAARRAIPNDATPMEESVSTAHDKNADPRLRILATERLRIDRENGEQAVRSLLSILADSSEDRGVRLAALQGMKKAEFVPPVFDPHRPEYFEILRAIARDKDSDPELREEAFEVLARHKDAEAQQLLLTGLIDPGSARVAPAKAIQFLGYDIHAGYFPVLRKIARESTDPQVRHEALRFLAADPESKDMFQELMRDKGQDTRTRTLSAIGLQSLDPANFATHARQVVLDDEENADLRASCLGALTHFAEYRNVSSDPEFEGKVTALQSSAATAPLRSSAARFLQLKK